MSKVGMCVALADGENQLLGFLQGGFRVVGFVGDGCNLPGGVNQTA